MRIASLCPAATEWVALFGAAADLVGRTHRCDFPPSILHVPVVTRPSTMARGTAAALSSPAGGSGGGIEFEIDVDALAALEPDLVLVGEQPFDPATLGTRRTAPDVIDMRAGTFKQALGRALDLGRRIGRLDAAMAAIAARERRLTELRAHVGLTRQVDPDTLPTVACFASDGAAAPASNPLLSDLIEMAGGRALGEPSGALPARDVGDWLCAADPDVLCFLAEDATVEEVAEVWRRMTARPGWATLRAVRTGRVHLFDGRHLFFRPGPRLYRAVELLAFVLHPDRRRHDDPGMDAWEMTTPRAPGDEPGR